MNRPTFDSTRVPNSENALAVSRGGPRPPSRWLLLSLTVLCLLGLAVSVALTRIHVFVHTDPNYHSVCAISEGVNCETVAASPYSVFAGLPVAVWGMLGYLVMGGLALWASSEKRLHPAWPLGLLLSLMASSVAISAVLAFISATCIDSLCLLCMGSYAINVTLLAIGLVAWRKSRARPAHLLLADATALMGRPALATVLALASIAALGALEWLVPSYWKTPGWSNLAKLASGADESGHHWVGARNPKLTITEFSDYECPHCRAAHKEVRILAAKHPTEIRLVHRHLPLDMACHPGISRPFHPHACAFAEAAECAGLQGHFWEMNDAFFSIQETVKADKVDPLELAVRLGLNRLDFKRCLASHAAVERITADVREAMSRQLPGTPSFLVGERLFLGRIPEAELENLMAGGIVQPEGEQAPPATNHRTGGTVP